MQYYIKSIPRANLDSGEQSYDGEYHLTIRAPALEYCYILFIMINSDFVESDKFQKT